jgi:hypothetical protein
VVQTSARFRSKVKMNCECKTETEEIQGGRNTEIKKQSCKCGLNWKVGGLWPYKCSLWGQFESSQGRR